MSTTGILGIKATIKKKQAVVYDRVSSIDSVNHEFPNWNPNAVDHL